MARPLRIQFENAYYHVTCRGNSGQEIFSSNADRLTFLDCGQPQPKTVATLARSGKCHWESVILAEGAKGPIIAKVTRLRVYPARNGLPQEDSVWLFIRTTPDGKTKFSFSNAPIDMPLSEMCKASLMRWPIEQCFEEGKGQLGMDHYEHRSWPAWHRHMIYVFLGLHFMLRLRIQFKKNSSPHAATSTEATWAIQAMLTFRLKRLCSCLPDRRDDVGSKTTCGRLRTSSHHGPRAPTALLHQGFKELFLSCAAVFGPIL